MGRKFATPKNHFVQIVQGKIRTPIYDWRRTETVFNFGHRCQREPCQIPNITQKTSSRFCWMVCSEFSRSTSLVYGKVIIIFHFQCLQFFQMSIKFYLFFAQKSAVFLPASTRSTYRRVYNLLCKSNMIRHDQIWSDMFKHDQVQTRSNLIWNSRPV